jgi:peptidoglycan hydrolase-like protein with peptidoglycan-binding domain
MSGAPDGRVTWLQTILRDEYVPAIVPDGQFGSKTDAALRTMQGALKVTVDGIYGNQTASARYAKVGK